MSRLSHRLHKLLSRVSLATLLIPNVAVALAMALLSPAAAAHADRPYSWTLDKDGRQLNSPLPYILDYEIDGLYKDSGTFKNPSDIFVDGNGHLWIADSGNNRVLEFDDKGG